MSEQATLQSIARSRHRKNFPLISRLASGLWRGYGITISAPAGAMSVTLTNAEKQARYRERHLGVDGEKVRIGLISISTPAPGRKWAALHHRGYTITALVEELVERAERRVTARLPSRALKADYDTE
jgi:hypothetical protein